MVEQWTRLKCVFAREKCRTVCGVRFTKGIVIRVEATTVNACQGSYWLLSSPQLQNTCLQTHTAAASATTPASASELKISDFYFTPELAVHCGLLAHTGIT